MNELYLRIAIDDIHRETDHRINGSNPYHEMDEDRHRSRMQRLINWTGTALSVDAKPTRGGVEPNQAIATSTA